MFVWNTNYASFVHGTTKPIAGQITSICVDAEYYPKRPVM